MLVTVGMPASHSDTLVSDENQCCTMRAWAMVAHATFTCISQSLYQSEQSIFHHTPHSSSRVWNIQTHHLQAEVIEIRRRWNIYPGARVDSEVPTYQLSIPEVSLVSLTRGFLGLS
jgi:hypothetical protein